MHKTVPNFNQLT